LDLKKIFLMSNSGVYKNVYSRSGGNNMDGSGGSRSGGNNMDGSGGSRSGGNNMQMLVGFLL
jgi:hypothetical protein